MSGVSKRYNEYKSVCSTSDLFDILLRCLATRKRTFLVVDALDKYNDRADAIEMLQKITLKSPDVSILLTSREETDVKNLLQETPHLRLEPESMARDIDVYVKNELRRLVDSKTLKIRQLSLEGTIADALISKADGM